MKKYIILLLSVFVLGKSFSQNINNLPQRSGNPIHNGDRIVYDSTKNGRGLKLAGPYQLNILDFGGVPDSVTDNLAAFNALISYIKTFNNANGAGAEIFIPAGMYYISGVVKIPSYVSVHGVAASFPIIGSGVTVGNAAGGTFGGSTIITKGSYDAFLFDTTGTGYVRSFNNIIENLNFECTQTINPTSGSAIDITNGLFTIIRNVYVSRFFENIKIKAGFSYHIENCGFYNPVSLCLNLGNNIEPDAGDFTVSNCEFSTNGAIGVVNASAIYWHGGGGMRLISPKFNGVAPAPTPRGKRFIYDLKVDMKDGSTADLNIIGGSWENMDSSAIYCNFINNFGNIVVTGIQVAGNGSLGPAISMKWATISSSNGIVAIGDNVFQESSTVAQPVMTFTNGSNITIGKSTAVGYTSTPLIAQTTCTNVVIDEMWTNTLSLSPGTLADQVRALKITATSVASGATAFNDAEDIQYTTSNSGNNLFALNVDMLAGATSTNAYAPARFANAVAGTGTDPVASASANMGLLAQATGTTTGTNVGIRLNAANGNVNISNLMLATTAKNSATNNGATILTLNTGTTPIETGLFVGLKNTLPTYVSSVVQFDNGTETKPIITAQANGSTVFSVGSTGIINNTTLTASEAVFTDGSKNLVSNAITGTGNVAMSASPTFTGVPLSTTATKGTNTTQIATTAFVLAQSDNLSYAHTIFVPSTGGTVALVNHQYNIINPAGALVALTVNLPSSPVDGDVVYIKFTQTVSTVTYGNGTVVDGITAPTAGGLIILLYNGSTTSWY